ncbi:hypothetical protein [Microterricola viridarii]|uniref:Uncharacterized protein n=1 Tax=Microterricola viridarii TaxID=412690 RepID=A0A1H1V9U2_9MICO|nr:hypothetical protein [Microterricola viridarii]SDS81390.1 hypothetical protein SAMN04489834_2208 [Microterricola viridarii]
MKLIEDYERPPRKSHKRLSGNAPARTALHFGINVRSGSRHGLNIDRTTYADINKRSSTHFPRELNPALWDALDEYFEDDEHRIHTDDWCAAHQARALENFDLNMAYFASLEHAEFDRAIAEAVAAQKGMVEVADLNEWDGKRGLYVMVLDGHRQAYVGITESEGGIKARVRQHWSTSKQFDRLLWGGVNESILSVDSFRALDTTRIFAAQVRSPLTLENKVIESLPGKFVLNRIAGGDAKLIGFASALGADIVKKHQLQADPTP